MMTNAELISTMGGSSVLTVAITAWATRRPNMLKEFTKSYTEIVDRVANLEAKVDQLGDALGIEREEHSKTRWLLALARHTLRIIIMWDRNGREGPLPKPPSEVLTEG